jgi:hypothetical protein
LSAGHAEPVIRRVYRKGFVADADAVGVGGVNGAIAPTIVSKLLLLLFRAAVKHFARPVQAVQAVVIILLPAHLLVGNMALMLLQTAVVISHARTRTHARALLAVVVDDGTAIPARIGWSSVIRALANLCQLPPAVVEEFVVDGWVVPDCSFTKPPAAE